ncbi:MAG: hypothetical protein EA375_05710 [Acholeplasmataceae bacterium]|nr:MAG: hypothetical protein EA375_05710 [Acholeplasmataceae bacterium]
MRFLFKIIVLPILAILFFPVLFVVMTYTNVSIPLEDFQEPATISLGDMVKEEIDLFLEDHDDDSVISVAFTQQQANAILLNTLRERNIHYADPDAPTTDQRDYVIKQDYFGYQGTWIRFKDDTIEIESGVHVFVSSFTYKTNLLMVFKLTADTSEVVLTLDKVNVGRIPMAWMFNAVSWVAERAMGMNIEDTINTQLGGLVHFSPAERELRVDVENMMATMLEGDPQSAALVNSLMQFIEQNELLDIGVREGNFTADLALGRTRDVTTPVFELDPALRITENSQLQDILTAKASYLLFSTLDATTINPYIELDHLLLNRMFDFFLKDAIEDDGTLHATELFDSYLMKAMPPFVTIDEHMYINIPITIEKLDNSAHRFQTVIKIRATAQADGNDLRIHLEELVAGQVSLSGEDIQNILVLIGDSDFISEGTFIIRDFGTQVSSAGLNIESVTVVNNRLRVYVTLNETIPYAEIQQAIQDVLETIQNNPEYPPALNDAINDVIDSLINPEADTSEAIEALLDVYENLTEQQQQELVQDLLDAFGDLDDYDFDFSDLYGFLPEQP